MWGKDPPRMPTAEAKGEHNMIPVSQTVTLVAGPAPTDPCTLLTVRTSPGAMEFGFESLTLADDSDSLTLDWGDGSVETITETVRERTHAYAAAGLHIIRLSDDIRALQVTGDYDPTYAFARYRLLPVVFRSTATRLTSLGSMALAGCTNLTSFDVSTAPVAQLAESPLYGCSALTGELRFPSVNAFPRSQSVQPFAGCTGLGRIRFAAANEAAIKATSSYQADPTLGSVNAAVTFDL